MRPEIHLTQTSIHKIEPKKTTITKKVTSSFASFLRACSYPESDADESDEDLEWDPFGYFAGKHRDSDDEKDELDEEEYELEPYTNRGTEITLEDEVVAGERVPLPQVEIKAKEHEAQSALVIDLEAEIEAEPDADLQADDGAEIDCDADFGTDLKIKAGIHEVGVDWDYFGFPPGNKVLE